MPSAQDKPDIELSLIGAVHIEPAQVTFEDLVTSIESLTTRVLKAGPRTKIGKHFWSRTLKILAQWGP